MMAGLLEYIMLNLLLLYCCVYSVMKVEGRVTISPPEVAPVCEGGQLELICTAVGRLEWTIIPNKNHSQLIDRTYYPTKNLTSIMYGDSTITFTRISHSMQLISYRIVISPVFNDLDGSRIQCTDLEDQESPSTVIEISIVNAQDLDFQVATITVRFISERFNKDDVEVILEWIPENLLYSYYIHVTPQPSFINMLNRSLFKLTVLYSILYNVSVVKMSPCGQRVHTINELYYANCENPVDRINDSNIFVEYEEPAIEGTYANFSCYSGYELTGLYSAECMDNGEWVPDPQEFEINCTNTIKAFNNFEAKATTFITTNLSQTDSDKFVTAIVVTIGSGGFLLLLTLAIVSMVIFAKRKGSVWTFNRGNSRVIMNNVSADQPDYVHDDQIKVATKGLVYVEVPFEQSYQQQNVILDLDDTHVDYAQLNHNQLVKTCSPPQMESQLGRPHIKPNDDSLYVNLDNLLIQLRQQVTPKWLEFGEAVGIEKEVLDYFASKCSPEECIVEMLDFWLRNSKEQVTWKEVARVLKAINLPQLAVDIESIYTTGKLPVEVDMSRIPNFQDSEPAARVAELLPPPVPPKKAAENERSSQGDLSQNQLKTKEISVSGPVLPPKPKTTFISNRRDNAPTRPPK